MVPSSPEDGGKPIVFGRQACVCGSTHLKLHSRAEHEYYECAECGRVWGNSCPRCGSPDVVSYTREMPEPVGGYLFQAVHCRCKACGYSWPDKVVVYEILGEVGEDD